jgi:catechol 2,3-dioxygenase-like lactoylglutathione lyase family enzyme
MPPLPPHFHVGIVVRDLAAARARLTDLLGVTWGPVLHLVAAAYRDGDGTDLELPTTICYSTGTPALELIEEVPGTIWSCNDDSNLHHLGMWSDDLAGDSDALTGAGCPLRLCGRAGSDAPVQFAYHRDDVLGIRLELLDAGMAELMSFLWAPDDAT